MNFLRLLVPDLVLFFFGDVLNLQSLVEFFVFFERPSFQDFASDFVRTPIQSFLSSADFIDNGSLNVEVGSALAAIRSVQGLHQVAHDQIHFPVILDNQVDGSRGEHERQALPGEEWEGGFGAGILIVKLHDIVIERDHMLPEDPEAGRVPADNHAFNVTDVAS